MVFEGNRWSLFVLQFVLGSEAGILKTDKKTEILSKFCLPDINTGKMIIHNLIIIWVFLIE